MNQNLRPVPAVRTAGVSPASAFRTGCIALGLAAILFLAPATADAFCGFYVAKADTALFNRASKVVLVRDEDRTVITMASDYRGALDEFAVVIPVPTRIEREQIHVAESAVVDHLDAYSAPRLVEYQDPDPCRPIHPRAVAEPSLSMKVGQDAERTAAAAKLGVTIEASYTVGEYDILILSARESQGLTRWLTGNGYRLPRGAEPVLGSYLRQGMLFFVAKVNLEAQASLGTTYLRPLQVAYESPKFMLPIRLGMVNADGPQELFIFALTRRGRVETTNYRTVKLPTGTELPTFIGDPDDFGRFYRDMFERQVERERRQAVFLEYAWDMAWCDPCAADPLSAEELRQLGVFWVDPRRSGRRPGGPAQDVFVTRLHLTYDAEHFPEDLFFQQTGDRSNFQGRYVIRHSWKGDLSCPAGDDYLAGLRRRQQEEARALASLTGWELATILDRMELAEAAVEDEPWWRRIWD